MPDPYVGEIQAFGFNFGQYGFNNGGWLPCDGRQLPIASYTALYSLIGTTYGGDGRTTFNLPNLNSGTGDPLARIAAGQGNGPGLTPRTMGEKVGTPQETITIQTMATHNHPLQLGSSGAPGAAPGPGAGGSSTTIDPSFNGFVSSAPNTQLAANTVTITGQGQPHDNTQPTLSLYYCICIDGIFPDFP